MPITTSYAHMWPREIYDVKNGKLILANTLSFLTENSGVYILYRNEEPHYIGKTGKKLYSRLWNHANQPRDKFYHFWTHFSAFAISDSGLRDELEGILIAAMPTANSANPKLKKEALPKEVSKLMQQVRKR